MYQETNEKRSTKGGDLLLVVALIALIVLARVMLNAIKALPYAGIVQLFVFASLIAVCFLVYKRRLSSYRFTVFNSTPAEGDLDEFGEQRKNPYPLGTFIAERMVGDKGRIMDIVSPAEMTALLAPGESMPDGEAARPAQTAFLSVDKRKTAHTLLYRRSGRLYSIAFHPTDELISILNEIISAVNEGR